MKSALAQDTTKSAKSLAQQIAKQMATEPLEILKNASSQITGQEIQKSLENYSQPQSVDGQKKIINSQQELQDKMKGTRRMEALARELEDMHKQDLFRDLQAKISEGEDVPLENYEELTMEQKQVLKAQMEAVKFQEQQAEYSQAQTEDGSLFGPAKKSRKMGGGQKQQAQKEQTRVEKPVPPSG